MDNKNQNASLSDYLGEIVSGNAPINQLYPQHPFLLDTLKLEEVLNKNTQHIMLLTMDEAYAVADALYDKGTTYAGNIKDTVAGAKNIFKLGSYKDAGKLVFNLKGLAVKATPYIQKGVTYIKISGYSSVRRILNGTRYAVNHPQILELGIGKAGINAGIMSGARFCIYFSAAQRVVEFIFSDHSGEAVAEFIGNITMDVAKVIVTIYVTKMVVAGVGAMFSITLPISVGIVLIIFLGMIITYSLFKIDKEFNLSEKLITSIRKGMEEQQKVTEWNMKNMNPYQSSMINGQY
ncbi:putative membrane protein [Buttiauxella brennerae ATCC 51605]|jgi:hypothetical protein|uniref:Putative membrane protein n=1 Tax=Buttiauxella brennerae ATCC 51605 TaxID=1354251 RepID=A0A1B7IWT8_9ENTR|nr:hypothetical protein [Buttiauxella]MCE0826416.1 hypothetical protein [Buttiauxella ferragutiae]OAT34388.1 putative membrane protein [Buttiauxella brennerae ATCC 51605]TDN50639.1 hypothetical protein EC843_105122 [Buttiauxella sp. JUb87]